MRYFIFLLITLSFSFLGCKKDLNEFSAINRESVLPTTLQLLEILKAPVNGYIAIGSQISLAGQSNRNGSILQQVDLFSPDGNRVAGGELLIGGYTTSPGASNRYVRSGDFNIENLYGISLPVSLEGGSDFPSMSLGAFYSPKAITILTPAYSSDLALGTGSQVTWVADSQNSLGIALALVYDSLDPLNRDFKVNSASKLLHLADNGSYTLTAADFEGMPQGGTIQLAIGRAGYKRADTSDSGKFVGVCTYSIVATYFKRQ